MKRSLFLACVGAALLLGLSLLAISPARAKAGNNEPASNQISIDNFTFGPDTLTVARNSTVIWVNKDDIPHVIASADGVFRSRALDTDQSYSFNFTKPGTYSYYCSIHPKMVGKIVVK